eukprot:4661054-Pleurochrysis_carterae.AAC.2
MTTRNASTSPMTVATANASTEPLLPAMKNNIKIINGMDELKRLVFADIKALFAYMAFFLIRAACVAF